MFLRTWHKLCRLVDFPRRVLMELEAIQTRQEEAIKRHEAVIMNFIKLFLQSQDASAELIAALRRQVDDHGAAIASAIGELKQMASGNGLDGKNIDRQN
jgi:hypothetical protein